MSGWRLWLSVAVLGFALGAGLAWLTRPAPPVPEPGIEGASVGDPRPSFEHADLSGEPVSVESFDGRALLVNFWATWCAPCRREMPLLQETSERFGNALSVVGIAMDDPEPVARFVEELGIGYPVLVGRGDVMDTQRAWGNSAGALPYTVLVDPEGTIVWQHLGEVTAGELDEALDGVVEASGSN